MTDFTPLAGLAGGALIGLSAVVLMAGSGRIAGFSGIFRGLVAGRFDAEFRWRAVFVAGTLVGAAAAGLFGWFDSTRIAGSVPLTVAGGLLVGAGAVLGSGCTSGHGICGLSRLSQRSLVATVTFMAAAMVTVFVVRHVIGA